MSHNDDEIQERAVRRLFFPGFLGFSFECLIAAVLLVVINFVTLENSFLRDYPKDLTFTSYSSTLLNDMLAIISQFSAAGQLILFVVWAIAGMLTYIVVFRLLQAIYGASSSINQGLKYVKIERTQGIVHWLATLHDFFVSILISSVSAVLFALAVFLAFVFAAQQVSLGLMEKWPYNFVNLSLALLATTAGVRLIVIGICLSVPRFARWYLN